MKINQMCASCKSVYHVSPDQYRDAILVYCPACGHSNNKYPPLGDGGSLTSNKANTVITSTGRNAAAPFVPANTRQRAPRVNSLGDPVGPPSLEMLREKVQNKGRAFVLGTGPSLNDYDVAEIVNHGWPCIGVNDAFMKLPDLDALVLADADWIRMKLPRVEQWQNEHPGKWIFWMSETKKKRQRRRWIKDKDWHGILVDIASNEVIWREPVRLAHSLVSYYHSVPQRIVHDLTIPLQLNFQDSVIFSAINLAYILGAKEICLLGVDLVDNSHFYNHNQNPFPKTQQILDKLKIWAEEYAEVGCRLRTCGDSGPVVEVLEYADYQQSVTPLGNFAVDQLRKKIKNNGRKLFLLGAGDSLNDVPLQMLCGWPVLGVNTAWLKYPWLDALVFGDPGFIDQYEAEIRRWQRTRDEKPVLFWHNEAGKDGFSRVVPWEHAPLGTGKIYENHEDIHRPLFALKHSIITPAINAAYWLGAKEIYLLGVDLGDNKHFWDQDQKIAAKINQPVDAFPGGRVIADFIAGQMNWLKEHGVKLAKCTPGGLLEDRLEMVPLDVAADPKLLNKRFELYHDGEKNGDAENTL